MACNGLVPDGRFAYAVALRKSRDAERRAANRRAKKENHKDERNQAKIQTRETTRIHLQAEIDRIMRHPSKLGIAILKKIATSRNTPPVERVSAAKALLELMDNGKPRQLRPSKARRGQSG
jgi:hypothetical protein